MFRRECLPIFRVRSLAPCFVALLIGAGFVRADEPAATPAKVAGPRVLPEGKLPDDRRLGALKDFDGYFPFAPSATREEWGHREERVRRQILVAAGLWPMPTRTPLDAVVHGKVDREGYTVEKVFFQSFPCHYVTGSLYRPKGKTGRLPAVLSPHGHVPGGRFSDCGLKDVRKQIVEGAERFEVGGRHPLQALCVQLARMGCIVFQYDMLGYADSVQIPIAVAHGYSKPRPAMDTPENWGFFSTQAELWQENVLGLQLYNSMRALDWLSELPDVDPARIAVTGHSGGGTQTLLLCGVDPRPAVAFPAVMVSTAMQGGCTCENACHLRIGTGNVEFAALFAPNPLGMTGADDWTKEIATKGLPELKKHYALFDAADKVMAKPLVQFGHNYNYVSREVMYHWFNKHLKLGLEEPVIEEDYQPLSVEELSVWDAAHPKPPGGEEHERALLKWMTESARRQFLELSPIDSTKLAIYRDAVGLAVDVLIGRSLPAEDAIEYEMIDKQDRGEWLQMTALLRYKAEHEELPAVFLYPKDWKGRVVIWIDELGKAGLFGAEGMPNEHVRRLLASGMAVAGVDLFMQGEFLADSKPPTANRRVKNPREVAAFTYGYNHSLFAQRVHDILSVISFCRHHPKHKAEKVYLAALGGVGPWGAAALAKAGTAVDRAAIDTGGFRFSKLRSIWDVNFLPGGARYGDLPGMLALAAPVELWLAGEDARAPTVVSQAYAATGASEKLTLAPAGTDPRPAAIEWLIEGRKE